VFYDFGDTAKKPLFLLIIISSAQSLCVAAAALISSNPRYSPKPLGDASFVDAGSDFR
jgi:hypothetical protein